MKKLFFSAILLTIYQLSFAQKADDILGTWVNASGKAQIEIIKSQEKYFGKIIWLREPNEKNGKPKLDKKNPKDNLKTKPIIGL